MSSKWWYLAIFVFGAVVEVIRQLRANHVEVKWTVEFEASSFDEE